MAKYLLEELAGEFTLYREEKGRWVQVAFNKKGYWQPVDILLEKPLIPDEGPSPHHSRPIPEEDADKILLKTEGFDRD